MRSPGCIQTIRPGPHARGNIVRIVLKLGVVSIVALAGLGSMAFPATRHWHAPMCRSVGAAVSAVLDVFGAPHFLDGTTIYAPGFAVRVLPVCTGLIPALIIAAAFVVSSRPLRRRLILALAGALAVILLNVLRLSTVLLLGSRNHVWGQATHDVIWPLIDLLLFGLVAWYWCSVEFSRSRTAVEEPQPGV